MSTNDMVSTTICVGSGTNLGRLASHALHVGGLYLLLPSEQHLSTAIYVDSGTNLVDLLLMLFMLDVCIFRCLPSNIFVRRFV